MRRVVVAVLVAALALAAVVVLLPRAGRVSCSVEGGLQPGMPARVVCTGTTDIEVSGPGGRVAGCSACTALVFTPEEKGRYRVTWREGSLEHVVRGRQAQVSAFFYPSVVEEGGRLQVLAFAATERGVEPANVTVMVSPEGREWVAQDCGNPCVATFDIDYLVFNKVFVRVEVEGSTIERAAREFTVPARGGYAVMTTEELVTALTFTTVLFAATTIAFAALWLRERGWSL